MDQFSIASEFVTQNNHGNYCNHCGRYFEKMWFSHNNSGGYTATRCIPCARKNTGSHFSEAKHELITSTFKCPAKKCSNTNLSFRDFVNGICCFSGYKKACEMYQLQRDEYHILENAKIFLGKTNSRQEEDLSKVVETKREAKKAQDALIAARKQVDEADEKYKKTKEEAEDIKALVEAMMDKINALITKTKIGGNEGECNVCFEKYNGDDRIHSTLHCGHRSCFKCLTELAPKNCPICRKEFTNDQIIRLF